MRHFFTSATPAAQERIGAVAESAALRRRLTAELRRLRSHAELTQRQVADALDWSPSKVIRIEQGIVKIGVTDLQALLHLYDVSDPKTVAELTAMARDSKKLPFAEYRDVASAETVRFFQYEANASILREVALEVVPGLLQTEEYTRALFAAYRTNPHRADKLIESRKERKELFERPSPPETFFVVDESVLRRAVGGPRVMKHQLEHLVAMSHRPDVSIQVLPFAAGAHPALVGDFVHLEFPEDDDPDVIFIENTLGDTLFRDDPEVTSAYREKFWTLEDMAISPGEFETFVRALEPASAGMV